MHFDLTDTFQAIIRLLFPPDRQPEVVGILGREFRSGDAERCCLAALKLSDGDLGKLRRAAVNDDWREMLMNTGFGFDPTAHESWAKWVKAEGVKGA